MSTFVRVRKDSDSVRIDLPESVLERFQLREGDWLQIEEAPEGLLLTRCDDTHRAAMLAFEEIRKRYSNTLRKLADS